MGAFDGPGADPTIEALAMQYGFDYEAAEQNLAVLFRMAHDHILEAVQRAILARPDRTPTQLIRLLNVVDAQYARALTGGARLVGSNTLNAFNVGAQAAEEQMARQRVRLHTSWVQVNRGAVQVLQQEQMASLLRATTLTEEAVKARVRRVMLEETRMLAATGMRAKEQAKVISERMAEDGVFGITAKNGRHIPMDEYARIVAHTKLREAHTTGTEQLVAENGHDLVRVTTHLHRPDACSPLEGKVYSISGRTPGYPPLVRHTPFHPGCRHVETPYVETFRSEAELEKVREESNRPGQITVYPQAQLDELEAKQKKRQRFMRAKRELRKQDQIDIGAGKKDAPKDPKAYERSLTARANARVKGADKIQAARAQATAGKRKDSGLPFPESVHAEIAKGIKTEADARMVGRVVHAELEKRLADSEKWADVRFAKRREEIRAAQDEERNAKEKTLEGFQSSKQWAQLNAKKTAAFEALKKDPENAALRTAYDRASEAKWLAEERAVKGHQMVIDSLRVELANTFAKPDMVRAEVVRGLLAEIRPMGRGFDNFLDHRSSVESVEADRVVRDYFPSAWWDHAKKGMFGMTVERGYCNLTDIAISDRPTSSTGRVEVMAHESGHHFEDRVPSLNTLANEFLKRRTARSPKVKLKDRYPGRDFDDDEVCKPDKFGDGYTGKVYPKRPDGITPTEIISMGMEGLYHDTSNFYHDKDHAHFMLGVLAGL